MALDYQLFYTQITRFRYIVQQQKCFLFESRKFILHLGYKERIQPLNWLVSFYFQDPTV